MKIDVRKYPKVWKDPEAIKVLLYIMYESDHQGKYFTVSGRRSKVGPSQILTSRRELSDELSIGQSKIQRILTTIQGYGLIETEKDRNKTLITYGERKTESRKKTENDYKAFIGWFNAKWGRDFKGDSKSKKNFIGIRKKGYGRKQFETVASRIRNDAFHQENSYKYVTPEYMLRDTIFEKYLNMQDNSGSNEIIYDAN